ncbi:MAG: glycosyltransferase family 9 protein [Gemmatimonadales bacterium]
MSETLRSIRRAVKDPVQSLAARAAVIGLDRAPLSLEDLEDLAPRAIVASRTDRIGDLLVSTPVLVALHERWPSARIVVIPGPRNRAVLAGLPFVEEGPAFGREPGSWARVRAWLKGQHFDISVSLRSESMAGAYVSAWSRAPVRMTLNANKTLPAHNLVLGVNDEHLLTRYCKAAALLGYEGECGRPTYIVPDAAEAEGAAAAAELSVAGRPMVGVQLMSRATGRHARRALAFETLVEVTRSLAADGATVVLCAFGHEREEAERIRARVSTAVLVPSLGLAPYAALQRRFAVLLSGYTGTLHLADAVGCATVAYGEPRHYRAFRMIGERHRAVTASKVPEIPASAVLEAVRSALVSGRS